MAKKKFVIPETKDIDELLSEEDALAQAAADGIEFVDFYIVISADALNALSGEEFKTKKKAEAWAKKNVEGDYSIAQGRRQKRDGEK